MRDDVDLRVRHRIDFAQYLCTFVRHHHQPLAALADLVHHLSLHSGGLLQQRVQSGHHRHTHLLEQCQQMTARRPAVNAKLVLHTQHVRVVEVQEICCSPIRIDVLLQQFKTHA